MPTQQISLSTPIKGVVRAVNREGQLPESCWDAQNCLPYDRYGRKRLAQRGGLTRQFSNSTGNFIQGMIEAPHIIYPPGTIVAPLDTAIPGYPLTFDTATTGPLPGVATPPGPWNGGWTWLFSVGANYVTNSFLFCTFDICFTFPTWLDMSGGPPGVLNGFQVTVHMGSSVGATHAPAVHIQSIIIASPTFPDSGSVFFPTLAPGFNQFPGDPGTSLWNFTMTLNQAGDWVLTDVTDGNVQAMGTLSTVPTMIPVPSLYRATITGSFGDSSCFFTT